MFAVFPCPYNHPWDGVATEDVEAFQTYFRHVCLTMDSRTLRDWMKQDRVLYTLMFSNTLERQQKLHHMKKNRNSYVYDHQSEPWQWIDSIVPLDPAQEFTRLYSEMPTAMAHMAHCLYLRHRESYVKFLCHLEYFRFGLPFKYKSGMINTYTITETHLHSRTPHPTSYRHLKFEFNSMPFTQHKSTKPIHIDLKHESRLHNITLPLNVGMALIVLRKYELLTDLIKLCAMYAQSRPMGMQCRR